MEMVGRGQRQQEPGSVGTRGAEGWSWGGEDGPSHYLGNSGESSGLFPPEPAEMCAIKSDAIYLGVLRMEKNIPWLFTVVAYFSFLSSGFVCFNAFAHLCSPDCSGKCLFSSPGAAASFLTPGPWITQEGSPVPPNPCSCGTGGLACLGQVHAQGRATEALRAVPLTKCSHVSGRDKSPSLLNVLGSDGYLVAFRGRQSRILPPHAWKALTHCLLSTPHRTGITK